MVRGFIVFPKCCRHSYETYSLKLILVSVAFAAQLLAVGCDPGMQIQQVNDPTPAAGSAPEQNLQLVVRTTNQLIGASYYFPQVNATNVGRSPIRVVKVELRTQNKTYANEYTAPDGSGHPVLVGPGETRLVPVQFSLENSVWETFFRHPADLLLYYQNGSAQAVARASIVGTRLDGSR